MRQARLALLIAPLLAAVLAGCTAPTTEDTPDLIGTCPSWVAARDSASIVQSFYRNESSGFEVKPDKTDELRPPHMEFNGHPLDRYELMFEELNAVDARIEGRAFAGDTDRQLLIRSFRSGEFNELLPLILFENEHVMNLTYYVDLAASKDAPQPGPIRMEWKVTYNVDGDSETPTAAAFKYIVHYWYRVCGQP